MLSVQAASDDERMDILSRISGADEQEILRRTGCREYGTGNGIVLRALRADDAADMYEYTSDRDSCTYLKWGPHTRLQQAQEFVRKRLCPRERITDLLWGIELIAEKKLIGVVRVYHIDLCEKQAEISYIINPSYSGNGYATAAVKKAVSICFDELMLDKVTAFYADQNKRSERLLKRCGAVDDEGWSESVEIKGKTYQMYRCSIERAGWYGKFG